MSAPILGQGRIEQVECGGEGSAVGGGAQEVDAGERLAGESAAGRIGRGLAAGAARGAVSWGGGDGASEDRVAGTHGYPF